MELVEILKKRPTIIFEEPPLAFILSRLKFQTLPPDVSPAEAILAVASTTWARRIAEGQARVGGLTPGTPEYERFVRNYAIRVAAAALGFSFESPEFARIMEEIERIERGERPMRPARPVRRRGGV